MDYYFALIGAGLLFIVLLLSTALRFCIDDEKVRHAEKPSQLLRSGLIPRSLLSDLGLKIWWARLVAIVLMVVFFVLASATEKKTPSQNPADPAKPAFFADSKFPGAMSVMAAARRVFPESSDISLKEFWTSSDATHEFVVVFVGREIKEGFERMYWRYLVFVKEKGARDWSNARVFDLPDNRSGPFEHSLLWLEQNASELSQMLAQTTPINTADKGEQALSDADSIEVRDIRSGIHPKTPGIITDAPTITAIVDAIQKSPAKWKNGWGTSPAGSIRFTLKKGSARIDTLGLGEDFLVRSNSSNWQTKTIGKETEAKLRMLLLQRAK